MCTNEMLRQAQLVPDAQVYWEKYWSYRRTKASVEYWPLPKQWPKQQGCRISARLPITSASYRDQQSNYGLTISMGDTVYAHTDISTILYVLSLTSNAGYTCLKSPWAGDVMSLWPLGDATWYRQTITSSLVNKFVCSQLCWSDGQNISYFHLAEKMMNVK